MRRKKQTSSFTLVEVLIFVSILSLFFVVAAAVTTASLRNIQISQHKIVATRYAEELMEWVRQQKEADCNGWSGFISKAYTSAPSSTPRTYCFQTMPADGDVCALDGTGGPVWPTTSTCSATDTMGTPPIFKRELTLKDSGGLQADATVTVSWIDVGGLSQSITETTKLSLWE